MIQHIATRADKSLSEGVSQLNDWSGVDAPFILQEKSFQAQAIKSTFGDLRECKYETQKLYNSADTRFAYAVIADPL